MAKKTGKRPPVKIGFWHMVRDVLIASMSKGQLPLVLVAGLAAEMIWKMPSDEVGRLASRLVDGLELKWLLGYVLFVLTLVLWYALGRAQRRWFAGEMKRVTNERNAAQERLAGRSFESSEKK
jgi:uncharacterized membrane protein YbhN (UPF0104 family)